VELRNLPKCLSRIDALLPPVLHESYNRDQIVQEDKSCRDGGGAPQSRCCSDTVEPAVRISGDRGKLPLKSVGEDRKSEKVEIEGGGGEDDDDGECGEVSSCVLQYLHQLSEQTRLDAVVEFEQEDDFLKVIEVVLR